MVPIVKTFKHYIHLHDLLSLKIKALTALLGRLSLSVGLENGPEQGLKTVSSNP